MNKDIYCCTCDSIVQARLTDGNEIYPHRADLSKLPFWICDNCSNYVGCHYKTKNRTKPLGCIPNKEIRAARQEIHQKLDSIWKSGKIQRKRLYQLLSHKLKREYHTANIRSLKEAENVMALINKYSS